MIVVDTTVVSYLYFPSGFNNIVEELHYREKNWVAPQVWKSEFLNIVSLYYHKKLISLTEGLEAFEKASEFMITFDIHSEYKGIMTLITSSACSSYDCEFVALAESLATKLITYDKQLLKEFPRMVLTPEQHLARLK